MKTPHVFFEADERREAQRLFANLKKSLPVLRALLEDCQGRCGYEDGTYRFYHQSFKVYGVQTKTLAILKALRKLLPRRPLNKWFMQIVDEGTGKKWEQEHNKQWLAVTRPILEAFFHARYFLEMAIKYGSSLDAAPNVLPSGWAAFLYLYDLR